jgi:hypothetical protein
MQYIVRGALTHGVPNQSATTTWNDGDALDSDAPEAAGMNVAALVRDGILLNPAVAKPTETQEALEAERARANDLEAQLAALKAQLEAPPVDASFPQA